MSKISISKDYSILYVVRSCNHHYGEPVDSLEEAILLLGEANHRYRDFDWEIVVKAEPNY